MKSVRNIIFGVLIGVVLIVVISSTIYLTYQKKQRERSCLEKIDYHAGNNSYSLSSNGTNRFNIFDKEFKTHDEAMAYCMKVR